MCCNGFAPAPAAGAPVDASYVVMGANATLTNERILTAGAGVTITDNGPGDTVVIAAPGVAPTFAVNRGIVSNSTTGGLTVGPFWDGANTRWGLASVPTADFDIAKSKPADYVTLQVYNSGANGSAQATISAPVQAILQLGALGVNLVSCDTTVLSAADYVSRRLYAGSLGASVFDAFGWSGSMPFAAFFTIPVTKSYSFDINYSYAGQSLLAAIRNTSNTASAQAGLIIQVAGATAGNPYSQWSISGVSNAVVGLNNASGDRFGAWYSATVGTTPVWVYDPAFVYVGIFTNSPAYSLDVLTSSASFVAVAARNTSAAATAQAYFYAEVAAATSADPFFRAGVLAVNHFAVWGIDNSDSDKSGWWASTEPGTNPITVYDPTTGNLGFLTASPAYRWHARWDSGSTETFAVVNATAAMRFEGIGAYGAELRLQTLNAGAGSVLTVASTGFADTVVASTGIFGSYGAKLEVFSTTLNSIIQLRNVGNAVGSLFTSGADFYVSAVTGTVTGSLRLRADIFVGVDPQLQFNYVYSANPAAPADQNAQVYLYKNGATRELRVRFQDGATLYTGSIILL